MKKVSRYGYGFKVIWKIVPELVQQSSHLFSKRVFIFTLAMPIVFGGQKEILEGREFWKKKLNI